MNEENDKVLLNIRIDKEKRKKLKLIATEKESTITELIMEFIDNLIIKHAGK